MNKTININLGGLFFHIDESAYQKLNKYLNSIRRSLSDDPQGRDEIIKDIEARISELLSEKIVDERQVVCDSDIDDIVKIMGQPEDYNVDEELFNEPTYSYKRKSSKKLFRDGDDKFLGGVASGTGHYLGIEPIWSRIIWLVLAFGTGFGFIAYPLLWILLPEAKSTSEKLEMEGESVNIDNIEKKIREEFHSASTKVKQGATEVSGKIKEGANEISDTLKKNSKKAKSGLQDFLDTIGTIILAILKIFAKFVGAFIIFFSALALLGLTIGLFSWGSLEALGIHGDFLNFSPKFLNTTLPYWLVVFFGFILFAIPFFVLFMLGLRILTNNTNTFGKITKLTLLAVWIVAILGLIFSGIDIATRYSHDGIHKTQEDIVITANDTLSVSLLEDHSFPAPNYNRYNNTLRTVKDGNVEKVFSTDVDFSIRKSDTDGAYVEIIKEGDGRNYMEANSNAESIEYKFNLEATDLKIAGYFLTDIKKNILDQEVDIILYLPEGYSVYLDKNTRPILDQIPNTTIKYANNTAQHYFTMGENKLECLDCPEKEKPANTEKNVNLKIDDKSVELQIKTEKGTVDMKVDSSGVVIK